MPKVNVYMKTAMTEEIRALVEEDIQAGANASEVSFSSKACMLLELGLRVYRLQRSEKAGSGHDEFDRMLMSSALEACYLAQFLTKTLGESNGINVAEIREKVKSTIKKDMEQFFPSTDDEES